MAAGPYWSEQESDLLRRIYATTPNSEVAKMFPNRAVKSIVSRASALGLKKQSEVREQGLPLTASVTGHLTEAQKGYVAGIIDGEGTIAFTRRKSASGRFVYTTHVSIATTSESLLGWLQSNLVGSAHINSSKGRLGKKTCYRWVIAGSRRCFALLREVGPYMVIKRRQAELVAHGYQHLSDSERDAVYQELRSCRTAN